MIPALMFRPAPPEAGRFAREHFEQLNRSWRRRARRLLPLALLPIAAWVALMAILFPHLRQLMIGIGFGAAIALAVDALDSPPEWIDKWRRGWHGERNTAKALRPLERRGWTVVHGLLGRRGDRDHVVAGPAGVFLLETKNLSGRISIEDGALTVRHGDDPLDSWVKPNFAKAVRGAAFGLQRELARFGVRWVTPVVVLWGDFPDRLVEADGVIYVEGRGVQRWLEEQPVRGDDPARPGSSSNRHRGLAGSSVPRTIADPRLGRIVDGRALWQDRGRMRYRFLLSLALIALAVTSCGGSPKPSAAHTPTATSMAPGVCSQLRRDLAAIPAPAPLESPGQRLLLVAGALAEEERGLVSAVPIVLALRRRASGLESLAYRMSAAERQPSPGVIPRLNAEARRALVGYWRAAATAGVPGCEDRRRLALLMWAHY